MLSRLTALSCVSFIALTACATQQENPYYKYSSKYRGSPVTTVAHAPATIQTAPVSYETANYQTASYDTATYETASYNNGQASYTRVNHECLRKEKNHELLGAGLGGTIGAIAGKKLIGGTKGTVIGAGLGGAAGYGIGDKTVDCDPQTVLLQPDTTSQSYSATPTVTQSYTAAPTVTASYVAPATPYIAEPYVSPTDTEFNSISETGTPGYQVLQAQTVEMYEAPAATIAAPVSTGGAQEVSYDYTSNTIAASAETVAMPSETRILTGGSYGSHYGSHIVKQDDTVYSLARKHCVGISDIQSLNNLNAGYAINIGDTLKIPASNC